VENFEDTGGKRHEARGKRNSPGQLLHFPLASCPLPLALSVISANQPLGTNTRSLVLQQYLMLFAGF